jgi:hypothetical protein
MTVTSTRQPEVGGVTDPTELLIREARAASRRRRRRILADVFCVLVVTVAGLLAIGNSGPPRQVNTLVNTEPRSLGVAKTSPYPATLQMQHGMYEGGAHFPTPRWGRLVPAEQSRWINIKSSGIDEWGVWRPNGDGGLYPVRSTDDGVRWRAAGPLLATDWAGGGIYYVGEVISDGPSSVVMTNGAVIDVTTDGGRQWYQYLNPAGHWIVSGQPVSVSIGIRIRPFPDGDLPKGSYATYVLNDARHEWVRTSESVGAVEGNS